MSTSPPGFDIFTISNRFAIEINHLYSFYYIYLVPESVGPPAPTEKCPLNLGTTCNLQCENNNYELDEKGCAKCACASEQSIKRIGRPPNDCPLLKCQANCGSAGYKTDENGCGTCECAAKSSAVECSRVMCRMFCVHGFRRDGNGCEVCKCNDSPQPCPELNCGNTCLNGYRKDYSGNLRQKKRFYSLQKKSFFFSKVVKHVHVMMKNRNKSLLMIVHYVHVECFVCMVLKRIMLVVIYVNVIGHR